MRKLGTRLVCTVALLMILAGLGSGSAAAAGNRKLVEGTVYDTTCATACTPECPPPPHCGPITADLSAAIVCPLSQQRVIACPLETMSRAVVCAQAEGCPTSGFPVYSVEGAVVKVRKRGSPTVLATLPVVEGHFQIRLGSGQYVLHPYLAEEPCWSGQPERVTVTAKTQGSIPASIEASDSCVAHPDGAR
jgi:hypothetical protein